MDSIYLGFLLHPILGGSGGGRGRLAGALAPARKIFSSLSLEILTLFRISLLIWPFLIFFSCSAPAWWLVILIIYNLPSRICMKPKFMLSSTIIFGSYTSGWNIDIYFQPLINELKQLWLFGVLTYDVSMK
jgi:hypothetical protein